jgi:prevent-host-death family protein
MEVTLSEAEKRLSELIDAAARGEDVVISRAETPVAKIVALPARKVPQFGAYKGRFKVGPEFYEPLPDDELALWNGE